MGRYYQKQITQTAKDWCVLMKRVLYIQHTAGIGGCLMTLVRLLEKIDLTRYEPLVLFLEDGPGVEMVRALGVDCHIESRITYYPHGEGAYIPFRSFQPWLPFVRFFEIWISAIRTFRFIKHHSIDLVHINSMVMLGSLWGSHLSGVPTILHVREVLAHGLIGFRRALIQNMIDRFADRVIAIASYNAAQLKPNPKIKIIYDTVDFTKFNRNQTSTNIASEFNIAPGSLVVGMLGGIVPHKGIEVFLKSAVFIHQRRPDILFLVAGYPPQPDVAKTTRRWIRHRLEDLLHISNLNRNVPNFIQKNNLDAAVIFTGPRSDIPDILSIMDVLTFPATVSHFGLPIIEAGAMAKPIVASDFPSTREIVLPDITGLLVPPQAPDELANAILKILDNPFFASSLGEAGYQQTKQKFDAKLNTPAVFAIYDELL